MASVTIWSRIEPRCRTEDMKAGLEARVHDPLWLLARQWQMSEFVGRDAGSPVTVQVQTTTATFDRYASGTEPGRKYDGRVSIEALVERETVRPAKAGSDLRQAAEAGLHFMRLLDAAHLTRLRTAYLAQYPLIAQTGGDDDAAQFSSIVSGRAPDGIRLHADLIQAGANLPALPSIAATDHDAVLGVMKAWLAWYGSLFSEPAGANSWSPDRMEYRFALGAADDPGSFVAQEYDGGSIDWYTFDRSSKAVAGGSAHRSTSTRTVMAAPVTFRGMPARRFWEMEDASVDIGALTAAAEDLGRLLLREFALIYGNDWFQIPVAVPAGCEVSIDALSVADTFGVNTAVPHYADADGADGRWRMFSLSTDIPATDAASASTQS